MSTEDTDTQKTIAVIKKVIDIVENIPEKYREKAFEVLLTSELKGEPVELKPPSAAETVHAKFTIPIDVRALMQQFNIPEEKLQKLFFMQGNEVRPTYQIQTAKKAKAQIQIALLAALESALRSGKFEFGIEDIRARCKEHRCYDQPNFQTTFKNNLNLFKSLDDAEHVELSGDGKTELAEAISAVAK